MVEVYGLLRRFERPASSEAGPRSLKPVVWKGQDRMSQASSTVGDVGSTSTTGSSFTRRLRVLAHLQPLLDIEHDKNRAARAGGAERRWDVYDMRLLQLAAFDAIAAEYGLHPEGGVPRDHVEREIADQAGRTAPDQSTEDHADVASWLVDRLLNVGHAARGFDVSWVDPADDYRRDDLRVIALYETLTSDGEVRLHADEAALNLALAGLDLDLEDRQIAAEAVLRAQIESGRWSQAEQSAAITRRIAVEYRNRLDRFLRSVERDLRDINWEVDVETVLEESLAHIETRVNVLHQLSDHATQLAEDVDPTSRTQAAAVVDLVADTLRQLLALQQHILDARTRFRAAQVTQGFAVSLAVGKVHLRDDVFQPLLSLDALVAGRLAPALIAPFAGPTIPSVPSLADLLELLLARPREREDPFVDIDLGELIGIDSPFERFDDETWDRARVLMGSIGTEPIYLSTLLERQTHEVALLVALCAMRCWGERGTADTRDPMLAGVSARDDGTEVKLERFTLPDLALSRSRPEGASDARG